MPLTYFPSTVSDTDISILTETALKCRGAILTMTTLAASGHPGGSMSSIDILLTLYKYANINPSNADSDGRDRIVVSIGHISPAVYSCLGENGFFLAGSAISMFRLAGSMFEGHIERIVPGVEWTTGNLGQGLSAACGMALATKMKNEDSFVYVLMGDGEQQKGQISEARRFAVKYKLDNLIAFVDLNGLQICGKTCEVMPQNIADEYRADGWEVIETDGHHYSAIVASVHKAQKAGKPTVILAKTVMGKGVSFMENQHKYHGSPLSETDYYKAMDELGLEPQLEKFKEYREAAKEVIDSGVYSIEKMMDYDLSIKTERKIYPSDTDTDCRSAFGTAITGITAASAAGGTPVAVFDCDLAGSIKTVEVEKKYPKHFFQCGIAEHNAASVSGAASAQGIISFYTGFAMFTIDEVYNQLRINDINNTNLKVISTHAGVDVGEDGRTHQCIDYLGLMRNLYGFKVIAPADPNQTDAVTRYAAETFGNFHVVMGRSKVPIITDGNGSPYYNGDYTFEYGKVDTIRAGKIPLISYGGMLYRAIKVWELLEGEISVHNAPTPAYINKEEIEKLASFGKIFVLEDHNPESGLYSTICKIVAGMGLACKVIAFGVRSYTYSGKPDDIFKLIDLDPDSVAKSIQAQL